MKRMKKLPKRLKMFKIYNMVLRIEVLKWMKNNTMVITLKLKTTYEKLKTHSSIVQTF
jgi:hypothetical protein